MEFRGWTWGVRGWLAVVLGWGLGVVGWRVEADDGVGGGRAEGGRVEGGGGVDVPILLKRMAERSRVVASDTNVGPYVFRKLAIRDTLDGQGEVKQSKEKVYEVTILRGMTHNRLVSVDGRELGVEESAALSEKERKWRETYSSGGGGGGSGSDRMDQIVNEKLFERYEFTVEGWEAVRGRRCVVLGFRPKTGPLPEERLMDRVLNLFRGRVWVDWEEAEMARAEVATEGPMRVWGGVLGSLERFELHLDRERSRYGIWFNRHAEIRVRARKLFSLVSMRVREVGSDLRPGS